MVDSGAAIARRTASLLTEHGIARTHGSGHTSFWTTGSPATFSHVAASLLNHPVRSRQANI
jgi:glutamate racemase